MTHPTNGLFRCRYCSGECEGLLEWHTKEIGCFFCQCRHTGELDDGEIPIEGSSPA